MSSRDHRPGIVGPALLISLGLLFLLDNLGVLAWSIWEIAFRLWPLVLVAWGLEMLLGRRSAWGAAFALIMILVMLVGGVFMLGDARLQSEQTLEIELPLDNIREADIRLDPAFAFLQVQAGDRASTLLRGHIVPIKGERIEQTFENIGSSVEAYVRTTGVIILPFLNISSDQASWDFSIHPETNVALQVDNGAGKTDLLLEGLTLSALGVDTGIGQTIVHLPDQGEYQAVIRGGLGQIIVILPDSMGVKLYADVGIGALDLPNNYRREGDAYLSPNYDQSQESIEVDVNLGIGSIEVR